MLRLSKHNLYYLINEHLIEYPTPSNLNYFWSFGSLSGLMLVIQIITGIFLAMHYVANIDLAFISIEHIMRDVHYGWLIRYMHSNGASLFFIIVYIHLLRGLYYGSYMYPRQRLWFSGVIILLLMMLTAFLGYILPWGQMSFWGATVITNLFSAIPLIGQDIAYWLWGGFAVNNATLNRFFSLHYLLPFVIIFMILLHLIFLHEFGSNNPLGISVKFDKISFYSYFYVKDLFSFLFLLLIYCIVIFFFPNLLTHPDNYIEANPLVTPLHIVPEWYFLPFYAILRSIPNKLLGVLLMIFSLIILFLLPLLTKHYIRIIFFKPLFEIFYWFFIFNLFLLGWLGSNVAEEPFISISQFATFYYYCFFLILCPFFNFMDFFILNKFLNKK